jgi:hypothetical protein
MKKVLFALFALAFVTSICFAEEASAPSSTDTSANPTQVPTTTPAPAQTSTTAVSPTEVSSTTVVPTQPSTTVNPMQVSSTPVASAQTTGSATTSASAGTMTFTGKVDLVSGGNGMSGVNPQITVKDDSGTGTTFTVASDATIIGKDGNATTLNWINKDDKVAIEYTTAQDGTKTAKSIKVSAGW